MERPARSIADRVADHDRLREQVGGLSDGDLRDLVMATPGREAWAVTHVVELDGHDLFVKRLPLTDRELAAGSTTANLFDLPVFYCYGVGSAGFGAYREVRAHEHASDLVVRGVTTGFPLLHHHRVMPRLEEPAPFWRPIPEYQAQWGGNDAIRRMIEERMAARHEVWVVAERIGGRVGRWLFDHPARAGEVVERLRAAAGALTDAGTVHFDAHYGNALTDGDDFYLSDFGLAMSQSFELSAEERAFLDAHATYDHALIIHGLADPLRYSYALLDEEAKQRADAVLGGQPAGATELVDRADDLVEAGIVDLPPEYLDCLPAHRAVIELVDVFLHQIGRPDKTARFDDVECRRLLGL